MSGESQKLIVDIFETCVALGWRIAVAESCTGGGLGAEFTSVAGSSRVFWGGVIAYANDVKTGVLCVDENLIKDHGAVSESVANAMCEGVASLLKTEIGIAITGVAGPGAEGAKPEGRVCFGFHIQNKTVTYTKEFGAIGRENVRQAAIFESLKTCAVLLTNSHFE